jgi:hypothetical protein
MTISVNEQVAGHRVTEQVMPEIRTHLEAALAAVQPPGRQPTKSHPRRLGP